MAANALVGMQL